MDAVRHRLGALIEQAKLRQGDFVIVTAASSSVGLAAFQMARMVGATSIAITRTQAKKQALLDAGAAHVIVSDEEDIVERVMTITAGQGARVVFDPVGGPSFEPLTQSMARGGILLVYGALSSEPTPFPLFTVLGKSLTLKGYIYAEIVADLEALERAKAFIFHRKVKTTGFQPVSFSATMRGWRASAWITDTAVIRSTRSSITLFG